MASAIMNDDAPSDVTTFVEPTESHTHTVIFLHGREDFGSDLAQYFFDSKSSDNKSIAELFPSVKFVFPTSALRFCARRDLEFSTSTFAESLKGEEIISQWFDVWDLDSPLEKQDLMIPGIRESTVQILDIVQEEAKSVPLNRIILGGISQGCATAILTLLSSGMAIGGFIGLCSWLPLENIIDEFPSSCVGNRSEISRHIQKSLVLVSDKQPQIDDINTIISRLSLDTKLDIPIFLSHSRDDDTVQFSQGEGLRQGMEKLGFDVTWKEYEDGGHWIHSKYGVDDIANFINTIWKF